MAGAYRTTFQCPDSGAPVTATYAFGRLKAEAHFDEFELEWWIDNELDAVRNATLDQVTERAKEKKDDFERRSNDWCKHVNGRYYSVDAANNALRQAGVDGMELLEETGRWR